MLGVLHTESRVARLFEINVVRRDPVTSNVELNRIAPCASCGGVVGFLANVFFVAAPRRFNSDVNGVMCGVR